jgi:hypothetical protein
LRNCGDGALIEFVEPSITVVVKGAVRVTPLSVSVSATVAWFSAIVRATVRGWILTLVDACRPPLSVAVSRSSRCDGYS